VILGLALGLGGIAFLVAPGQFAGGSHVDPLGAAALLTAALLWAIGSLHSRRVALPTSTLLATAMEMIAGGAILLAVAGATREWRGFLAGRRLDEVLARARVPDRGRLAARFLRLHLPASARRRPRASRHTPTSIRSSPCSSDGSSPVRR